MPVPSPTAPDIRAWRRLLEGHQRVLGAIERRMRAEHGLSISEFDVLVNIDPGEQVRHVELADRVILSRSALTRLVDRLIGRDLLARCPEPTDGRGVRIALTPAGVALRREAMLTNATIVRAQLARLAPAELAELERLAGLLGTGTPAKE